MPMRRLLAALGLAAGLLGLAGAAQAAEPKFVSQACPADLAKVANKVDCGMLVVDEARGVNNGRHVALPVVILHAKTPKAGLPPVVYLHGGPGGAAVEGALRRLPAFARSNYIAQDQDWIFFDQRGAGLATPKLDCGQAALNDAGPLNDATAKALIECGQRHAAAGVDLSRYNADEVARDIQDLRKVLKLPQIDLYGVSYGTAIAFTTIRTQPQGVRAVVLDSPWPPEATWAEDGPKMVSNAVARIFSICLADPACKAKYPDAGQKLNDLATAWLAKPFEKNGRTYTADDLGGFLMDAAYFGAPTLPRDIYHLASGDMTALDEQIAERSGYDEGQHLTHLCKEEFPFEDRAKVVSDAKGDPVAQTLVASMTRYFQVCDAFPVGKPDPAAGKPVSSSIPTLFLAAEIDPGCPPELSRAAAKRFSRSQLVIVPNVTHGVAGHSKCAQKMIRDFLADPSKPVDQSCLAAEHAKFVFNLD